MASIWRDPVVLTFIDADNRELGRLSRPDYVPRVGENVRLRQTPHVVERVGYDIDGDAITNIWIVCRPV
ncbi:hypothetical protein [uncultured Jatrophihabitans sp.]|uniref:hypothetical protein n=1 Tax=uncultured Jatrophihabitans sp. TaxID=1610747 RepID=UPI0035CC6702